MAVMASLFPQTSWGKGNTLCGPDNGLINKRKEEDIFLFLVPISERGSEKHVFKSKGPFTKYFSDGKGKGFGKC